MAIFYKPEGLAGPMASKKSGSGKRFQFPKFEREAFLEKEVRDAKVSFISLGIATLMVILSLLLSSVHVGLALIIGFLGPFSLYVILPAVGIDTSEFERKNSSPGWGSSSCCPIPPFKTWPIPRSTISRSTSRSPAAATGPAWRQIPTAAGTRSPTAPSSSSCASWTTGSWNGTI